MNDFCRATRKPTVCEENTVSVDGPKCTNLDICLGLGRVLQYRGGCISVKSNDVPMDGWYGKIRIEGGCIVEVQRLDKPAYVPPPCAPNPGPCGEGGGSGSEGGDCECFRGISNQSSNLLSYDSDNKLLARLYTQDSSTVKFSGTGSHNSPLTATATGGGGGVGNISTATQDVIEIKSNVTGYIINLKEGKLSPGEYGQFTIDSYGRVVGYNSSNGDIQKVIGGPGVKVTTTNGVVTVELETLYNLVNTYVCGGTNLTVDLYGRVSQVDRGIDITAGNYQFGNYQVGVNEFGSITGISSAPVSIDGSAMIATMYQHDADSPRTMTLNMSRDSHLFMQYDGVVINHQSPGKVGISFQDNGVYFTVDGARIPGTAVVFVEDGAGEYTAINAMVVTSYPIAAGDHIVALNARDLFGNPGVFRVSLVDRGA